MSKYTEAITTVDNLGVCDSCGDYDRSELNTTIIEALEIADRVSQIDYMEMPTQKIIETDNGVKATANLLEAVDVISHNTLLAKIKGEEERIYAK